MAIIKTKRTTNFTTIPNALISDSRLNWKDLGLLVYLLSKPETWSVRVEALVIERGVGRDAVYVMLKRLRDMGYAKLIKYSNGTTEWTIFDKPNQENPDLDITDEVNPDTENTDLAETVINTPYAEKPNQENPDLDFPHVLVKKDNKKINNSQSSNPKEEKIKSLKPKKIKTYFPECFEVDLDMVDWASKQGIPNEAIKFETQKFKDNSLSKGLMYLDWLAAWRNWMRNAASWTYKKTA